MHYMAAGTRYLFRRQSNGESIPRVVDIETYRAMDTELAPTIWRQHALAVTAPGQASGVRVLFDPDSWAFQGWYVNLQRPLTRTERGFSTVDDFLDIVVEADGAWRWKDEDELAMAIERGRLSALEAMEIRAEGERMARLIERRAWPFDGSLADWRPDPGWTIPTLSMRDTP
jgi:hypothetical protein